MSCYIVITGGQEPRYASRNKLMRERENAALYSSPSAAVFAAKRILLIHDHVPHCEVHVFNQERYPDITPKILRRAT